MNPQTTATEVAQQLESAWNAGDGAAFAAPFAPDADFVNIRGELHSGAEAIAAGHQGIFDTIYSGSTVDYAVHQVRELSDGVILAHVRATLAVPGGPLAGRHDALASMVIVGNGDGPRVSAFHNTLVTG